jgi:hypothetical protein
MRFEVKPLTALRDLLPFAKAQTGEGDSIYAPSPARSCVGEGARMADEGTWQQAPNFPKNHTCNPNKL